MLRRFAFLFLILCFLGFQHRAEAATFDINFSFSPFSFFSAGSLTGTITTDGTNGSIGISNIVSFDLFANTGSTSNNISSLNGDVAYTSANTGLTATATDLIFDFNAATSRLSFGSVNSSLQTFTCEVYFIGPSDTCFGETNGVGVTNNINSSNREFAFGHFTGQQSIGTVSPVPLPAGLPLLLVAFGMLSVVRRKTHDH